MIRYLTAGESHGKELLGILEGIPAGLMLRAETIDAELLRRQQGYGRGKRMEIEQDRVMIVAGLRQNRTIGSPLAFVIENKDSSLDRLPAVTCPRPGHADLAGGMKYHTRDFRDILERASARETAGRVAAGAVCKELLRLFGIEVCSHVVALGGVTAEVSRLSVDEIKRAAALSPVMCADAAAAERMVRKIDEAVQEKDTLGGIIEVIITGVCPGLGSHVQWDRRLDGAIARAVLSIPAIKGVEFGMGFAVAAAKGSAVHDEISYVPQRSFVRRTNRAGGLEGGMSNGEPIVLRAAMKPIATLMKPLASVDIRTKEAHEASVERSDTCAVPAAGVVAEAVCAIELANAVLEKFGGDTVDEIRRAYDAYRKDLAAY